MSAHDKCEALENWKSGAIKVMVCTSAFGMGIDKEDIELVLRIGCPPSLETMVQEFGRAGRDGRLAKGAYLYMGMYNYQQYIISNPDLATLFFIYRHCFVPRV